MWVRRKQERVSITLRLPTVYDKALESLVKRGLYRDKTEIILAALRKLFREHGLEGW